MHDATQRYLVLAVVVLALLALVGSSVTFAVSPGPVVAVPKKDPGPQKWDPVTPAPEPTEKPDKKDEPQPDCQVGGPRPLSATAQGTTGLPLLLLTSYPGPVVRIREPAKPPCRTEVSLSLEAKSPKNADPDGADATLEGVLVPRRTLLSGYRTEFPADHRTITLSDPGEEWELKAVECTCRGETGAMALAIGEGLAGPASVGQLTAYPGPVVAVPGASSGSTSCQAGAASAMGVTIAVQPGLATSDSSSRERTTYPGPVIAVPPKPKKWEPPEPTPGPTEPPARKPAQVRWSGDGTIKIRDQEQAGAIVDCKWTVEHVFGRVTVRTVTEPPGKEGTIRYKASAETFATGYFPQRFSGSTAGEQHLLRHGAWSLEAQDPGEGWDLVRSKCQEADGSTRTTAQGTTAQLGVDVGDDITCTFRWKLITPKEGPWRAVNGAGVATCSAKGGGSVTIPFGKETGTGRIIHHDDGDRLEMKGKGSGLIPVDAHRNQADPRRYRGTTTRTFSGAKAKFIFVYNVITEKKMTGSLTATWKQGKNKCVIKRPVTLTYTGK